MKARHSTVLATCFVLLFLNTSNAADKSQMTATDAVRAADGAWMKAFAAKDLDKSVAFCDEKGAVLAPNAPIAQGRQAIAESFVEFFKLPNLKITWHADKADVARSGELGYTSGTYEMSFTDSAGKTIPDKGKYVTLWKKQPDGSWKVLLDIFNTDMPAPGAA
jgi:ketosteroid isomerase-like protein